MTRLPPHSGPNTLAAGRFTSVGWPLRSLPGWFTVQLAGYHNPLYWSLALVGWPSRSLAGCLILQLRGYCCPIVGILFTADLWHPVLLLNFWPDCPANLVQNYHRYTLWAIGPHLSLLGRRVFSGPDPLSVLGNTRSVGVLADLLPQQA